MHSSRKFSLGSYKNGIETALGLLDETLLEFEAWADGRKTGRRCTGREID